MAHKSDSDANPGRPASRQRSVIDQFIEAGIAGIDEVGIDRLSVSRVTRAAGSSRPTFYSYFGNISGLVAEIWLARGSGFLATLTDPTFRWEEAPADKQAETRALLEIFTVSRRLPEVAEVLTPAVMTWWASLTESDPFIALKRAWLVANRLGMWLTSPTEPRVMSSAFVEAIIALLPDEPSGLPADKRFATIPHITDPVLANRTVEGQLMDAAIRVISASGASAATMSRIARNAQVTTGTIYPRFITNDDLLLKSFDVAVSDVVEQNFDSVTGDGFAPDQFGAIVMAGLKPPRRTWRNYRFEMYLEARYNEGLSERLRDSLARTNERVEKGLRALPVNSDEREAVAFLIHTIGIGMAILVNNGVPVDEMDHRLITRDMVAALASR